MRKNCSLRNTHGNEYVLAVLIFSLQNLISYVICKRKRFYCISNRVTEHSGFWGRSLYQIRHRKKGTSQNDSCSVSRKGMSQASEFENKYIFFLIYHEEESVQRLRLHKICLPGYQVTSLSPAITASQPLLRSETHFPPFTIENLWIASQWV